VRSGAVGPVAAYRQPRPPHGLEALDLAREFEEAVQLHLGGEEAREAFETRGQVGFHLTSETVTGRARERQRDATFPWGSGRLAVTRLCRLPDLGRDDSTEVR